MKPLNVFIDTSIYENLNFQTESEPLSLLSELSSGGYVLVLEHTIAKRELFKRIKKLSKKCCESLSAFRNANYLAKNVRATPYKQIFSQFDKNALECELCKRLEEFFRKCQNKTVPCDSAALPSVLDLYFDDRPPFDLEEKKHEFPDALIIHDICKMSESNDEVIHIVSVDGDFERALCANQHFVIHKTLESFLREVYGKKFRWNEDAFRRVSQSKKKLKEILAAAFVKMEIINKDGLVAHEVTVEEVKLSKIVQVRFKNSEGEYQVNAEFEFKTLTVENLAWSTPLDKIIDPDHVGLTVPCLFTVRFSNSTNRIVEWKQPVLNYGNPITVTF